MNLVSLPVCTVTSTFAAVNCRLSIERIKHFVFEEWPLAKAVSKLREEL